MPKRIRPDRPLTQAEKTQRHRVRHPEWVQAANIVAQRRKEDGRAAKSAMKYRAKHPITQLILAYRAAHPCLDCGEADIVVLEFDHVRGRKAFGLDFNGASKHSVEEVQAEIVKCDVVCANCHRRRTTNRARYSVHTADRLLMQVFPEGR